MIKLIDLIKESASVPYEYGCVMLYFNFPLINKIHDIINPEDVYNNENDPIFGLENEPHCTLLYGLHKEVTLEDVTNVINNAVFGDCKLYNASLFENEKYDVLKFDVGYPVKGGAFLHKCNKELKKFPYTSNFPDYHPHLTIAYLNPGSGKKYTELLKNQEFILTPQYVVYSQPSGDKNKIKINLR